jgi:hypothetical protein
LTKACREAILFYPRWRETKNHFDGTGKKHLLQSPKGGFTDEISAARKRKTLEKSAQNVPFFGTKRERNA